MTTPAPTPDRPERTDRTFMKMIRARVAQQKPMSQIAAELGMDCDDLCAWIMAYTEPKPAVTYLCGDTEGTRSVANQRQRNWERARSGAANARAK